MSAGFDHINMEEVKRRGIKVGFTPDVLTDATAELTVALLLSTSRRLLQASAEISNGGWQKCSWSPVWMLGPGLTGSTVGIFGLGKIGQAVMQRLSGFGVGRFIYSGNTEKKLEKHLPSAEFVSFDALLKESDFIVVTAALNDATRGKFDKKSFVNMKKTAIFINTSRGAMVDQEALVWALKEGEIRAAGLDVMMPEPLPPNHVLTTLPNCTLLPHIGSAEESTRAVMAMLSADNLIGGLTPGGTMKKQLC
uniref:Glyoxylate reductase/hydroxypyruvate reductase n=1 Tax=Hirondellea gigas TaxID=1518452 RepID=A0A2P2I0K2_9CRUS